MSEMPDSTHFKENAHAALQDAPLQNALRFVRAHKDKRRTLRR